jgi:hypothetical protein
MSPADVFFEWEMPQEEQPPAAAAAAVDDWDAQLLVPAQGRMVYVGQGQMHYTYFHEPIPGLLYPKKKKKRGKKKKKASSQQPPSAPVPPPPSPAPIDWGDLEEMYQTVPHWGLEIAASQDKEDWDAEIAASQ